MSNNCAPKTKKSQRRRPIYQAKCVCGKSPFYSEEAAQDALRRYQHAGQVNERRNEVRYYECEHADTPTWHLTSKTEAQYQKRVRQAFLAAVRQCGGTSSCRSVSLNSPAAPALGAANPFAGVITIRVGEPHA